MQTLRGLFETKKLSTFLATLLLITTLGFGINWVLVLDSINVRSQEESLTIEQEEVEEPDLGLENTVENTEEPDTDEKLEEVVEEKIEDISDTEKPVEEEVLTESASKPAEDSTQEENQPELNTNTVLISPEITQKQFLDGGQILEVVFAQTEKDNVEDAIKDLLDRSTENEDTLNEAASDAVIEEIVQEVVDNDQLNSISSSRMQDLVAQELEQNSLFDRALRLFNTNDTEQLKILEHRIISEQGEVITTSDLGVVAQDGNIILKIAPPSAIGRYTAEVTLYNPITDTNETVAQDFEFGVLVANTNQDKYLPDSNGSFEFGALDGSGTPVCGANISTTITTPDGILDNLIIADTGLCGTFDSANTLPDYSGEYTFGNAGVYTIESQATIQGRVHNFSQEIEVVNTADYIVRRRAATRLYPGGYAPMEVEIIFGSAYTGVIEDTLPDDFAVKGSTSIEGSWKAGDIATLSYEFDAPDVSPFIYQISNNLASRAWNIANDRILTDTNNNAGITTVDNTSINIPITFTSGVDFPPGSVITDVNLITNFHKRDGSCTVPGTGSVYNNEIGIRVTSPQGTLEQAELTGGSGYTGNVDGGTVTVIWDEDSGATVGSVPASGTFNPNGNFNDWNGQSPFGIWNVTYQDTAGQDPLCVFNTSLVIEVEAPGVTIVEDGGSTAFAQEGENDENFTVVLDTQPTANVVVDVTPSDNQVGLNSAGAGNAIQLTFTPANWNTPQNVNVLAIDDDIDESTPYTTTISTTINTGSTLDSDYDAVPSNTIDTVSAIINGDNDTAGVSVSNNTGKSVTEGGATDIYNFVLDSEPTANVTITLDPDIELDLGNGGDTNSSLLFTQANWNTPQTITITAVDDSDIEGSHTGVITHSVTSGDGNYNGISISNVTAAITDNDSIIVEFTNDNRSADEDTLQAQTITVSGGITTSNNTVEVFNLGTGDADAGDFGFSSPLTVTVPAGDYSSAQTIPVIGLTITDDSLDESSETINFGLQNPSADLQIGDANGDSNTFNQYTYTILDNDTAGITVVESGGSTTVSEEGTTDTFTIVLDSEPAASVSVQVGPDGQLDVGNGSGTANSIVFTPANWDTPQTITVTAVDDSVVEGPHNGTVNFGITSGDSAYNNFTVTGINPDITDNDTAGFTASTYTLNVNENGGTATFNYILDAEPQSNVVIDLISNNTAEATVNPSSLTFTPANWNTPQMVTVTGVNDDLVQSQSTFILASINDADSDDAFDILTDQSINITINDDDVAGVVVTPIDTFLSEPNDDGSFSLVLTSEPTGDVTIPLTSSDISEGTVPASVTFTAVNWNVPQTVTVSVVDDPLSDGSETFTIITGDITSSDANYGTLLDGDIDDVTMTASNDDPPGFNIQVVDNTTSEDGGTATVQIKLLSQPVSGDVVLPISLSEGTEGSIAISSLTFLNADWDTFQTITITGLDDDLDDGDIIYTLITGDPTSSDAVYDALVASDASDIAITNIDNDVSDVLVTQSGGNTATTEGGADDTVEYTLTAEPTEDVDITVIPNAEVDLGSGAGVAITLTFNPANWDTPQTVTVTANDDSLDEGAHNGLISHTVGSIADSNYDGVGVPSITVSISDNDTSGITVTQSGGSITTSEGGTNDTFTVVLDSQPTGTVDVLITPDSQSGVGFGSGNPRTLTFSHTNWDTPQTVTVNADDDILVEGTHTSVLTLAASSSDTNYDGYSLADVSNQIADNDIAGFDTNFASITVDENGGTATFTVTLDAQPLSDVVIDVSSFDTNEATVAPTQLTFTPANWNTPQVVTVTGVDDAIDRDDSTNIILSINDVGSDDLFDALTDGVVGVILTDDDNAGITITPPSLTLTEGGASDDFTVVLDSEPTSDVIILVGGNDDGAALPATPSLIFTSANWNIAQTVTLSPVSDTDVVDENITVTFEVDDASSDDKYDPLSNITRTVIVDDSNNPGFTIYASLSINEGDMGSLDVVLTAQPTSDVVIDLSSNDTGAGMIAPTSITFTPANWNVAQTVVVNGVQDDDLVNESVIITATINDAGSDDDFDIVLDETSTVTISDDDTATIIVSPGSITVNENAGSNTFTAVLGSQPQSDVVIDLTSLDTGEAVVSPSSLIFTPANWDTNQTVTVTGVDDSLDQNDSTSIIVSVNDAGSDDDFDTVADETVTVTLSDDDTTGITITETSGTSVIEGGATDSIDYALESEPTSDVVVTVTPDAEVDLGNGPGTAIALTFTPANWFTTQTVVVKATDDVVVEGAHTGVIDYAVTSGDTNYDNTTLTSTSVAIGDNDTAGFDVTPTTLTIDENGGTGDFEVVLTAQPLSDVVLTVFMSVAGESTLSTNSLTFTPANWDTAQTVTVTGVDDAIDRDDSVVVAVSVDDTNSDDLFDPLVNQTIAVTLTDNDSAGVTVSTISGDTGEDGTTATFTAVLDSEPLNDVTVELISSDVGEGVVISNLVFTPTNWDTAQTVTVTGVDDAIDDGDIIYTVVTDEISSIDIAYDNLTGGDVNDITVTNIDNDIAGITVTESSGSTEVVEGGASDTISYVLDTEPTSNVDVVITPDAQLDLGTGAGIGFTLTFTPANWDTAQDLTVTAVDDAIFEGAHSGLISHSFTSTDLIYAALSLPDINTTITDNDSVGFNITHSGGTTAVTEGGSTDTLSYTLNSQPTSDVVITITPDGELDLGSGAGNSIDITFTAANWNVAQDITIAASDDSLIEGLHSGAVGYDFASADVNYNTLTRSDTIVVITDNDDAGFTINTLITENVDEESSATIYSIVLDAEPTSDVIIEVSSNNTNSLAVDTATITFTPTNWNIPQNVTVSAPNEANVIDENVTLSFVIDDANSDDDFDSTPSQSKAVVVIDNDTAGFTLSESALNVGENAGTNSFTVVLDAQPQSDVTITLTSDNTGEALVAPASITFTAATWNVPQTIVVTGVDDDVITATSATITASVDDANSDDDFDSEADQAVAITIIEDDAAGFVISEVDNLTDETGDTGNFSITLTSQPTHDVVIPLIVDDTTEGSVPASITITPANWNIPKNVTVTGVDDNIFDGSIQYIVITGDPASSDPNYDALIASDIGDIIMDNQDDDPPGVIVTLVDASSEENGGAAVVQFSLVSQIAGGVDITVPLSLTDTSEGDLNGVSSITIANADWNTPSANEVLILGVDDNLADGDIFYTLITGDPITTDSLYSVLTGTDIADPLLQNIDDDISGIVITENDGGSSALEGGLGDDYDVVLTSEPTDDVTVTIMPDVQIDLGNGAGVPISVTFTPSNWNIPQNVAFDAEDDNVAEGSHNGIITHSSASSDPAYTASSIPPVTVAITDNDTAGLFIVESAGSTDIFEDGATDSYDLILTSQPNSDVVVTLTPDSQADLGAGGGVVITRTFTPANWDTPQTIIVEATNDSIDEGVHNSTITHTVISNDTFYNGLVASDVVANISDDDITGVTINAGAGLDITEGGAVDAYTVVLDTQPIDDVIVTVTPDTQTDLGNGSGVATTLTFTAADWNTPQTIVVVAVDDLIAEGSHSSTITHAAASSGDAKYNAVNIVDTIVTIADNDTAGVILNPLDTTTGEDGSTAILEITLTSQPVSDVTIALSSTDTSEGVVPPSITISAADWNTGSANQVIITGVNDTAIDGDILYQIITGDVTSNDSFYDVLEGSDVADESITNADNDVDTDGDGVPDEQEMLEGADVNDPTNYLDSDGDGVPDYIEIQTGSDPNDGSDYIDSDNGGTPDYVETVLFPNAGLPATDENDGGDDAQDTDGDGVPDYVELLDGTDPNDNTSYTDSDGDLVPDYVETENGTDPNAVTDYQDSDGDLVPDYIEELDGTDVNDPLDYIDSDGDLVPDYVEVIYDSTDVNDPNDFADTDSGGAADYIEMIFLPNAGLPATDENDGGDDAQDTDGDGVPDWVELVDGTDPQDDASYTDTDGDQVPDYVETENGTDPNVITDYQDSDNDGVPDYVEERDGTDPNNPNDYIDGDGDLVPDYVETILDGTDPTDDTEFNDSDNGGVADYIETFLLPNNGVTATDPNSSADDLQDSDGDGVPDIVEIINGTDPNNISDYQDSDGDLVPDYVEGQQGSDSNDPLSYVDTDGDLVPDYVENTFDSTDPNDITDFADTDTGGAADYVEVTLLPNYGTNALDPNNSADDLQDTDGDGVPDWVELIDGTDPNDNTSYVDSDGDLVPDYVESGLENSDPNDINNFLDTDGDGVPDYIETRDGTDVNDPTDYTDTDGDNVPDYIESVVDNTNPNDPNSFLDTDGGGMPDYTETTFLPNIGFPALDPSDPSDDTSDTDGDTVPDYIEIINNTDINNTEDDGDGVDTATEYAAPNDGDGNGDGVLDYAQSNVASVINGTNSEYATLEALGSCEFIDGFEFVVEASLSAQDTTAEYFIGLHGFALECGNPGDSADITVIWDREYDTSNWVYKKFNPGTNEYSFIDDIVTLSTRTIGGTLKTITEYSITDGGDLDVDGAIDGRIEDPAGPAIPEIQEDVLLRTGGQIIDFLPLVLIGIGFISLYGAWAYRAKQNR